MRRFMHLPLVGLLLIALALSGCTDQMNTVSPTEGSESVTTPLFKAVPDQDRVPDSYIVVFKDEVRDVPAAASDVARTYGARVGYVYQYALKGFSATVSSGRLTALQNDPRVAYVDPDYIAYTFTQTLPWGIDRIDADISSTKAGDGSGSVTGVQVYILDTGIQLDHPDLNVAGWVDFTGKGTADDGNGHGTHVAGSAGAIDNTSYVVGVAPGVALYAVKVLGDDGSGSFSQVIAGVDYVTQEKQNNSSIPMVANMSLGARTGTSYNSLDNAVVNSIKVGVVYSIAAGNDGADAKNYSPAHVVEAITVGAYDINNNLASWSNWGSVLDLQAPGVSILSTWIGSSTKTISGTSMAAPHVAGTAALLLSNNASMTPQQVRDRLVADGQNWVNHKRPKTTKLSVYAGKY